MKTKTVSVAQLGHGKASEAIREAEQRPVLISKENRPTAWIVSAEKLAKLAAFHGAESSSIYQRTLELLAVEQYEQGKLTLGQAARLANQSLADFVDLCSQLQVPVLWLPVDNVEAELEAAKKLAQLEHRGG